METLTMIWWYLLNVGTNTAFVKFITGNILLLSFIAYVTPWKGDNKIVTWLKTNILRKNGNGNGGSDEEKPKE